MLETDKFPVVTKAENCGVLVPEEYAGPNTSFLNYLNKVLKGLNSDPSS